MLDKIMQMKQQMDEMKKNLDLLIISENIENNAISISMNGNKKVTAVKIDAVWLKNADAEEVEELLQTLVNKTIDSVERAAENQMRQAASGLMPNLGGLFGNG